MVSDAQEVMTMFGRENGSMKPWEFGGFPRIFRVSIYNQMVTEIQIVPCARPGRGLGEGTCVGRILDFVGFFRARWWMIF